ncbi:MAG: diacylglycerol kinase family protein [Bacteroidota bacterium]|nr:diacylglycerol kinase family protein [Bacteroidota bacterium]
MSYFKKRIQAFGFAFNGLFTALKTETHLKIHLLATILVVIAGIYSKISKIEWIAIIICCGTVIAAELFNSAIEKVCDIISPDKNPKIKFIKDVSAGAVLVLSLMSICVAVFIFASNYF